MESQAAAKSIFILGFTDSTVAQRSVPFRMLHAAITPALRLEHPAGLRLAHSIIRIYVCLSNIGTSQPYK